MLRLRHLLKGAVQPVELVVPGRHPFWQAACSERATGDISLVAIEIIQASVRSHPLPGVVGFERESSRAAPCEFQRVAGSVIGARRFQHIHAAGPFSDLCDVQRTGQWIKLRDRAGQIRICASPRLEQPP